MKPLKISYITNARIPTQKAHGLQIIKMCEAFVRNGHTVELVLPRKKNLLSADPFEYYGVPNNFSIKKIFSIDFGGRTSKMATPLFLLDLTTFLLSVAVSGAGRRSDLVYTRDYLLPLFVSRRRKVVVEIHDIPKSTDLFLFALKRAYSIVTITQGIKNVLVEKGIDANKILVASDAIDLETFARPVSKDEARKKLSLQPNQKIAMYIGLFDEWKGYKILLAASSELNNRDIQVVMIGGTEEQVSLLKTVYPEVVFLGFRKYSELPINQRAADVLVIPNSAKDQISKYFTSPLKLFAHMASGVPIVASDLPSLREVLNDENAFFATPDNPHSLAEAIQLSLSDNVMARKKADLALADVQKFTWDKRAKNIITFLFS